MKLRKFAFTAATVALLAAGSATALETTATGSSAQLSSIKQFVDSRFTALEGLIDALQGNVNIVKANMHACGALRQFTLNDDGDCGALWVYEASGPEASFDGRVIIGTPGASSYVLDVDGQMRAAGYFHNSDATLKTNVQPLDGLAIVNGLRGVKFDWKDGTGTEVGLIAQEVEAVLPEVVTTDEASGIKAVDYAKVVAPLIEAVKTLEARVEELEKIVHEAPAVE